MTDHCYPKNLIPVDEAQALIIAAIQSRMTTIEVESIPLNEAVNRILAEDVISSLDLPPQDNSAMDGYALRAADLDHSRVLKQVGTALAGQPFIGNLGHGECIRIMTGAPIPDGADSVIMQELTEKKEETITIKRSVTLGESVRPQGENVALGQTVLTAGKRLDAASLTLLASLGQSNVKVKRQLVVGVMATGDELVAAGQVLNDGQIYEGNRVMLTALLHQFGAKVIDYGIIPDDFEKIRQAMLAADQQCDLLITSGGVSVGDADLVKDVLDDIGDIGFWKVAIKPGKPFAFGRLPNAWFCGLPGNPVSSYVTCQQLVFPLMAALQNEATTQPVLMDAIASGDIKKQPGRMDFQRAVYEVADNGVLSARPNGPQGSGIMTSVTKANCYIVLDIEAGSLNAGDAIKILPFDNIIT